MQTKRQLLLSLLTTATAMMVAPHAGAVTYTFPGTFNPGVTSPADSDIVTISSGAASGAATTTTAGAAITIAAGATVTTSTNNPVFTSAAGAAAPLTLNVSGTLTANSSSNSALTATAWTLGGANAVAVNILPGGVVTGDFIPGSANANSNFNIVVGGVGAPALWTGDLPGATALATANSSTLTVSGVGSLVTQRSAGIASPVAANAAAFLLKLNTGGSLAANVTVGTATSPITLSVDNGASTITGNIVHTAAPANSILTLGSISTASPASLTVTGLFDGLRITQAVPGTLQFNGLVGSVRVTGAVAVSAGSTIFKQAAITGNYVASGTNITSVTGNFTPALITMTNTAKMTVSGNLLTSGAVSVGDNAVLNVTGTATSMTTFSTTNSNFNASLPWSVATFDGNFAGTTIAVAANTAAVFKGTYTQTLASTNAGNMTVLGSAALMTNGMTNSGVGNLVFGAADGRVVAVSGGAFVNTTGLIKFNSGVTLAAACTLTANGGLIQVGQGISLTGAITAATTGIIEFFPGTSLSAGITNATGVIKVNGIVASGVVSSFTFSGGNYGTAAGQTTIAFDSSSAYGQINVTGAAATALSGNGAFVIDHTANGYVAVGKYPVLITTGVLTATSGNTAVINNSKTTTLAVDFGVTTTGVVTVTATRTAAFNTFASQSNAKNLLASLNSVSSAAYQGASNSTKAVLDAIENTIATHYNNPAAVDAAVQTLLPNVSAIATGKSAAKVGLGSAGSRLDAVAYDMGSSRNYVAGSNNGDAVWMRSTYTYARQTLDTSNNYAGYSSNQTGAMIGFDTMRFAHSTLGIGLGYTNSRTKDKLIAQSTSTVKSFQLLPYGSYNLGDRATKGFIDWFASYAYNSVTGTRMNSIGAASGAALYSYNSSIFSAKGAYGLDRVINRNLTFTPFVSALASYQPSTSYTETGYAPQVMKNESNFGLEFELGVKGVVRPDSGSKANTRLAFRAMGLWSAINNNLKSTGTLVGTESYTYSVSQQKFGARAGVSAIVEVLTDLDFEIAYDVEAKSKYMTQTGFVEFKYHF